MRKKLYVEPTINVLIIEIEAGIAASSATINPGGSDNSPEVEDWIKEEFTEDFFFNN